MGFSNILALCGGLGLFLFGMKYMGAGLELAAGPKLNNLLEKLTRNPVMGFLLGVFVTACVQSSSATTIMCMGFLNAGIMDLLQAAGVILGANVGTTMTSILIALDVSWLAPVCIFVGAPPIADRNGVMDEPTLIPQIRNAAKCIGINPCMASACSTPTAADEL